MNIDEHLRKFRPAAPPSELRSRVLAAVAAPRRMRVPWRLAAAVLLGVVLIAVNGELERRLVSELGPVASPPTDVPSVGGDRSIPSVFVRLAPRSRGAETTWAALRSRELSRRI